MNTPLTAPPAVTRDDGTGTPDGLPSAPRSRMPRPALAALAGLLVLGTSVPASAMPTPTPTPTYITAAPAASSVVSSGTLRLPDPTGPHPIGRAVLHLEDASRPDPWVPTVNARELMVSVWYPAHPSGAGGRRAPYMTPKESELLLADGGITEVPPDVLSTTRTHAIDGAEPAGRRHGLPLIVLSPGFAKPRATLTSLAEELASRGYVVAGIDHTYENVATTFPDGRVATCAACEVDHDRTFWEKLETGRAADVSFVLDELTTPRPTWKGARLIDPHRIAMAGHSVGGASTGVAMLADPRIRAGIDIDGTTDIPIPDSGLARPFLFLGRQSTYTPGGGGEAGTWERDWRNLTEWKRWLVVAGAQHASFTDVGLLAEQLGLDFGAALPAARTSRITRRYTGAFFDLHLHHRAQPLLDQPSHRYPEVGFCSTAPPSCVQAR